MLGAAVYSGNGPAQHQAPDLITCGQSRGGSTQHCSVSGLQGTGGQVQGQLAERSLGAGASQLWAQGLRHQRGCVGVWVGGGGGSIQNAKWM